MKKLIKNEICGSVNNAYMHCSRKTGQKLRLLFMYRTWIVAACGGKRVKKKKKKKEGGKRRNATQQNATPIQTLPKSRTGICASIGYSRTWSRALKMRDCHYKTSLIRYWGKGSIVRWYKELGFLYL